VEVIVSRGRRATVVGGGLSTLFHLGLLLLLGLEPRPVSLGESGPSTVVIDLQTTSVETPPEPPPAAAASTPAVEQRARRDSGEAQEGSDEPDDGAGSLSAPAAAAIAEAAPSEPPTKAPIIAPETARALRVYDTFPMMLAQNSVSRAEVMVEVCVSDHGQVSDAIIAQSSLRGMDNTLRAAIRSWRYRPLVVNGAPTPFCHFMRIKYAMN
jgi:TonB family protein